MFQQHSIAFSVDKNVEVPEKYGPWNRLVSSSPSYPAFCPDLSLPMIQETISRKTSHKKLITENPCIFRKTDSGGTGAYMHEKHNLRNYLNDIHPLTLKPMHSRLPPKPKNLESALDDIPLTDFSLPAGPTRPRTTGFSPGHVRSMLSLDTFGPLDSANKNALRQSGSIPQSPNTDHWKPLIDGSSPAERTFQFPPGSPNSKESTKRDAFLSTKTATTAGTVRGPEDEDLEGSRVSRFSKKSKKSKGSTRSDFDPTQSQRALMLTTEEKIRLDPVARSKHWHTTYKQSVEESKMRAIERKLESEQVRRTESLALSERSSIDEFEKLLKHKLQHA